MIKLTIMIGLASFVLLAGAPKNAAAMSEYMAKQRLKCDQAFGKIVDRWNCYAKAEVVEKTDGLAEAVAQFRSNPCRAGGSLSRESIDLERSNFPKGEIWRLNGSRIYAVPSILASWGNKAYTGHCDDGPAEIRTDGTVTYYRHSKLHRRDGPARYNRLTGLEQWYLNGLPHHEGGPALANEGWQRWYENGQLHREDGPAEIHKPSGLQTWYRHGKRHREDGPAHINPRIGLEEWYFEGELHREDGPAVTRPWAYLPDSQTYKVWYWHGEKVCWQGNSGGSAGWRWTKQGKQRVLPPESETAFNCRDEMLDIVGDPNALDRLLITGRANQ